MSSIIFEIDRCGDYEKDVIHYNSKMVDIIFFPKICMGVVFEVSWSVITIMKCILKFLMAHV